MTGHVHVLGDHDVEVPEPGWLVGDHLVKPAELRLVLNDVGVLPLVKRRLHANARDAEVNELAHVHPTGGRVGPLRVERRGRARVPVAVAKVLARAVIDLRAAGGSGIEALEALALLRGKLFLGQELVRNDELVAFHRAGVRGANVDVDRLVARLVAPVAAVGVERDGLLARERLVLQGAVARIGRGARSRLARRLLVIGVLPRFLTHASLIERVGCLVGLQLLGRQARDATEGRVDGGWQLVTVVVAVVDVLGARPVLGQDGVNRLGAQCTGKVAVVGVDVTRPRVNDAAGAVEARDVGRGVAVRDVAVHAVVGRTQKTRGPVGGRRLDRAAVGPATGDGVGATDVAREGARDDTRVDGVACHPAVSGGHGDARVGRNAQETAGLAAGDRGALDRAAGERHLIAGGAGVALDAAGTASARVGVYDGRVLNVHVLVGDGIGARRAHDNADPVGVCRRLGGVKRHVLDHHVVCRRLPDEAAVTTGHRDVQVRDGLATTVEGSLEVDEGVPVERVLGRAAVPRAHEVDVVRELDALRGPPGKLLDVDEIANVGKLLGLAHEPCAVIGAVGRPLAKELVGRGLVPIVSHVHANGTPVAQRDGGRVVVQVAIDGIALVGIGGIDSLVVALLGLYALIDSANVGVLSAHDGLVPALREGVHALDDLLSRHRLEILRLAVGGKDGLNILRRPGRIAIEGIGGLRALEHVGVHATDAHEGGVDGIGHVCLVVVGARGIGEVGHVGDAARRAAALDLDRTGKVAVLDDDSVSGVAHQARDLRPELAITAQRTGDKAVLDREGTPAHVCCTHKARGPDVVRTRDIALGLVVGRHGAVVDRARATQVAHKAAARDLSTGNLVVLGMTVGDVHVVGVASSADVPNQSATVASLVHGAVLDRAVGVGVVGVRVVSAAHQRAASARALVVAPEQVVVDRDVLRVDRVRAVVGKDRGTDLARTVAVGHAQVADVHVVIRVVDKSRASARDSGLEVGDGMAVALEGLLDSRERVPVERMARPSVKRPARFRRFRFEDVTGGRPNEAFLFLVGTIAREVEVRLDVQTAQACRAAIRTIRVLHLAPRALAAKVRQVLRTRDLESLCFVVVLGPLEQAQHGQLANTVVVALGRISVVPRILLGREPLCLDALGKGGKASVERAILVDGPDGLVLGHAPVGIVLVIRNLLAARGRIERHMVEACRKGRHLERGGIDHLGVQPLVILRLGVGAPPGIVVDVDTLDLGTAVGVASAGCRLADDGALALILVATHVVVDRVAGLLPVVRVLERGVGVDEARDAAHAVDTHAGQVRATSVGPHAVVVANIGVLDRRARGGYAHQARHVARVRVDARSAVLALTALDAHVRDPRGVARERGKGAGRAVAALAAAAVAQDAEIAVSKDHVGDLGATERLEEAGRAATKQVAFAVTAQAARRAAVRDVRVGSPDHVAVAVKGARVCVNGNPGGRAVVELDVALQDKVAILARPVL